MKDNDQQLLWETYIDDKKPEEGRAIDSARYTDKDIDNMSGTILENMDADSVGEKLKVAIKTLFKAGYTMVDIVTWPLSKLWELAGEAAKEKAYVDRVMDAYGVDEEEAKRMIAEYDRASREYTGGWRGRPDLSDFIKR